MNNNRTAKASTALEMLRAKLEPLAKAVDILGRDSKVWDAVNAYCGGAAADWCKEVEFLERAIVALEREQAAAHDLREGLAAAVRVTNRERGVRDIALRALEQKVRPFPTETGRVILPVEVLTEWADAIVAALDNDQAAVEIAARDEWDAKIRAGLDLIENTLDEKHPVVVRTNRAELACEFIQDLRGLLEGGPADV